MKNQTVHYLKDYTPPPYCVPKIYLRFEIGEKYTDVMATLYIEPQQSHAPLVLYGDATLLSITLNDEVIHDYQLADDVLTIFNIPDTPFTLGIATRVVPQDNLSCNGLYASSANLYTQCEPEGFRRITYHPDRPDVMSVFTTEIVADKTCYPVLLSNGNLIHSEDLPNNQHKTIWYDPFPKPSYLFALVAGDLYATRDTFITQDNRLVNLIFYTRKEDAEQVLFALQSLKNAMQWDEKRFGLSYDLDTYMVVAVGDFNMGAMENKGLNIFNTKYVLANSHTATDSDFADVESVIGHEYFHNWTGNRVTCRDWFQLSLKEGLTVFRDQEFSADQSSRAVRRIENVSRLRTYQFAEDASPMAHPVRPDSYVEMNNFYTMTVYEKGAEVVRMYHSFLGEEGFQKGMKLYFERHDGQAVTCDDFLAAMADANQINLDQFALWYSQAGTPTLSVQADWCDGVYYLHIQQSLPDTPDRLGKDKQAMMLPLALALYNHQGEKIAFALEPLGKMQDEAVITLNQSEQTVAFYHISPQDIIPSLLRGFSAPVLLQYDYSDEDLALLLAHDDDAFCAWEAGQTLYRRAIWANEMALAQGEVLPKHDSLLHALKNVLRAPFDAEFKAQLLHIPAEAELWGNRQNLDPVRISMARTALLDDIAHALHDNLLICALNAREQEDATKRGKTLTFYEYNAHDAGLRALQYACFALIHRFDEVGVIEQVYAQYDDIARKNMTHEWGLISTINHNPSPLRNELLSKFAHKFAQYDLVMDKYFGAIASSHRHDTLQQVRQALSHPQFSLQNPNKVRALIGGFARNIPHFHAKDGSGYAFVAEHIAKIDTFNPQVAASLARLFNLLPRLESRRQALMRQTLISLTEKTLSKDTREVIEKILA